MKKYLTLITALFIAVIFVPAKLGAFTLIEPNLDQYQVSGSGGNSIRGHQYSGQSFKPTVSNLNKVSVKLKGAGEQVFIQMTRTGDNGLLLSGDPKVNTTVDGDYKWYDILFTEISVIPGQSYTLWLGTYGDSFWSLNAEPDNYANGVAYIDCLTWVSNASCDHWLATADWDFKVYGYTPATPAPPTPPVTPSPSSPIAPAAAATSAAAKTTANATTKTSATVDPPVLTSASKNTSALKIPIKDVVTITQNGKLILSGTSTAGAEVSIILNEKTYPATMEVDGNLKVTLLFKDLAENTYSIKGRVTKGGVASAETEFLKVKVKKATLSSPTVLVKGWYSNWSIFLGLVAVGTLLLVLLLLLFVAKRHNTENLVKAKPKKPQPKTE